VLTVDHEVGDIVRGALLIVELLLKCGETCFSEERSEVTSGISVRLACECLEIDITNRQIACVDSENLLSS
jgi:hypothetical protein